MLIGTIISTGFSGIMRAEGDVFYSTIQWCCPVIINLLLDPLFIYGFQMGISGAAIATLIAQLFSAGISIYYFFVRKKTPCRVTLGDIKWSGQACKEILYIGLPAFLNSLGSSLAGIVGNQILGQIGGTQAISTYTLILRIQSFLSTPFFGIMQGIQPMLGFDWGRQRFERVKRTVSYAIFSGFVYGCIIAVCIYWGAGDVIKLFSANAEIIAMGKSALQIICCSLVIGGIMPVIQAYFLALGYGKKVLFLSLESIFIIRLPLLLAAWWSNSLDIVWWLLAFTEWLIAGLAVYNYKIERKGQ
ncbi:MATE family efflux transporter [Hungatella hathewayi]|uniref:MATE family efflux transporter n=1 Tax=Hungatella hathewayi TaxID=154046 RepID=UPI0035680800